MTYPYGETVTWLHRSLSGEDSQGNDTYTETPERLQRVPVWPRDGNGASGNELTQGRDTVFIGYQALIPPGVTVAATDRATWRGATYEIDGEPARLSSPFTGWRPGTVVSLKRVTG